MIAFLNSLYLEPPNGWLYARPCFDPVHGGDFLLQTFSFFPEIESSKYADPLVRKPDFLYQSLATAVACQDSAAM